MSPVPDEIAAVLARIPFLAGATDDLTAQPLQGGQSLNNANFLVRCGRDAAEYVLRVATPNAAAHLGVSRQEEIAAARAAAGAGLAPEVLWADGEAGHLLTRRVTGGRHWEAAELREPRNRVRVADALRRLHGITTAPGHNGAIFRRIERLVEGAARLGLETPPGLTEHRRRLQGIEAVRAAERGRTPPGLNHNDFWLNNFLDDGEHLWLLDWEFAGRGDGLYDLATTALAGGYTDEDAAALLGEYGLDRPSDRAALAEMKWVVLFFEGVWSLVMHGLRGSDTSVPGGYDYLDHSRRMFSRMGG
jgi:thiamine kinase-like enzyme